MSRTLGLDIGDRRIGISISDSLGITAQWLTTLTRQTPATDVEAIAALVRTHQAQEVVAGLPLTMKGELGEQAQKVMVFVEALRAALSCPVHVMDERLTTVQSERALLSMDTPRSTRKKVIDQLAAQLILQAHLDVVASKRAHAQQQEEELDSEA